jgi:hypothetical protein
VTGDQRAEWRKALAAAAKATRNQRGRRKRGLATVSGAGMVRVPLVPCYVMGGQYDQGPRDSGEAATSPGHGRT